MNKRFKSQRQVCSDTLGWQILWLSINSEPSTTLPCWPFTICPEWHGPANGLHRAACDRCRYTTRVCLLTAGQRETQMDTHRTDHELRSHPLLVSCGFIRVIWVHTSWLYLKGLQLIVTFFTVIYLFRMSHHQKHLLLFEVLHDE